MNMCRCITCCFVWILLSLRMCRPPPFLIYAPFVSILPTYTELLETLIMYAQMLRATIHNPCPYMSMPPIHSIGSRQSQGPSRRLATLAGSARTGIAAAGTGALLAGVLHDGGKILVRKRRKDKDRMKEGRGKGDAVQGNLKMRRELLRLFERQHQEKNGIRRESL